MDGFSVNRCVYFHNHTFMLYINEKISSYFCNENIALKHEKVYIGRKSNDLAWAITQFYLKVLSLTFQLHTSNNSTKLHNVCYYLITFSHVHFWYQIWRTITINVWQKKLPF